MSHRPIERKQRRRVAKILRRRPLPAYINLVDWLKDRRYARTTSEAHEIILAHRVKADFNHVLGVETMPVLQPGGRVKDQDVVAPMIQSTLRGRISVTPA